MPCQVVCAVYRVQHVVYNEEPGRDNGKTPGSESSNLPSTFGSEPHRMMIPDLQPDSCSPSQMLGQIGGLLHRRRDFRMQLRKLILHTETPVPQPPRLAPRGFLGRKSGRVEPFRVVLSFGISLRGCSKSPSPRKDSRRHTSGRPGCEGERSSCRALSPTPPLEHAPTPLRRRQVRSV